MSHLSFIKLYLFILLTFVTGCNKGATDNTQFFLTLSPKAPAYSACSFSFDDKRILLTSSDNIHGSSNLYSHSFAEAAASKPTQLTNYSSESIAALSFFPYDDRTLFSYDAAGTGLSHLYLREANGKLIDLTPTSQGQTLFHGWAHDSRSFWFSMSEELNGHLDIYERNSESFEHKRIFRNELGLFFGALSPNKRYLALGKEVSANRIDLYLYDTQREMLINLSDQDIDKKMIPQAFDLDSNSLYFLTNDDTEHFCVKKLNLLTGKVTTEYTNELDIVKFSLSHNGTFDILTFKEPMNTSVKVFYHNTKKRLPLPMPSGKVISELLISRSEHLFLLSSHQASRTEHFLYNKEEKTILNILPQAHKPPSFETTEYAIQTPNETVPALLYQPISSKAAKRPLLVWTIPHFTHSALQDFRYLFSYFTQQGYAVLVVGSSSIDLSPLEKPLNLLGINMEKNKTVRLESWSRGNERDQFFLRPLSEELEPEAGTSLATELQKEYPTGLYAKMSSNDSSLFILGSTQEEVFESFEKKFSTRLGHKESYHWLAFSRRTHIFNNKTNKRIIGNALISFIEENVKDARSL